ncbi:MAG: crossover junction endodeoxyribonuclease RuvC [Planctomycetota bacterium]
MSAAPARVLGIDPGSRVTGWGVVEVAPGSARAVAWGTLRLDPEAPIEVRLEAIHRGVAAVLGEHDPGAVAVEEAFVGRNVRSAIRLAEARAVCLLAARFAGHGVHEVPPALVKKALTGHGQATKEAVRVAVMRSLGWAEETRAPAYDAADALAIAVCVAWRLETPAALRPQGVGRRGRRGGWTLADVERQQREAL